MLTTKEIRWFTRYENKEICDWFANCGLTFNKVEPRTDYFLLVHNHDDMAPKLREGKIEIKHRVGSPTIFTLTANARGYFEEYVKWSFELDSRDELSAAIINNNYPAEWIEVRKERLGVKFAKDNTDNIHVHDIKTEIDNGCQLEYTRLSIKNDIWYTFNLEWFGERFFTPDSSIITEIIGDNTIKPENSMGYGQFLQQYNH